MPGSHKKKTLKDRLQKISSIAGEGKNLQDPDTYMIESYKRYKDRNKQLEKETTDAIKKYDEKHGTKTDVDKLEEGLKKRLDKVRKAADDDDRGDIDPNKNKELNPEYQTTSNPFMNKHDTGMVGYDKKLLDKVQKNNIQKRKFRTAELTDVTDQHKKKSKDKEKLLTKQGKGVAPNYNNPSKVKKKRLKGKVSKQLIALRKKVNKIKNNKPPQGPSGGTADTPEGILADARAVAKTPSYIAQDHEHSIQFKGYRGQFYKRASLVSTQGKFAKYWLLNAKQTNGNGWGVSQQSIAKNIHKFIGRPLVVTAKSWVPDSVYGDVYEHPYLPTNDIGQVLDHQEKYRVGNIVDIIEKNGDYYANIEINQKFAHMILPPFCSPAIFQNNPAEAEGQISDWEALHLAALHEDPAYGSRIALLRGTCVGTHDQCTIQFKSAKQEAKVICTKDLKGRLATLKKNDLSQRIATFKNKTATPMSEHSGIFNLGGTSVEGQDIAPANYKGKGKKLVSQPNIKVKGDIRINKYSDLPPQKIGDPHPDMKSEGNIKSKNVRTKHGVEPRYTIKNKDIPAERVEGAIVSTDEGITHLPSEVSLKRDLRSGAEKFVGDKSYHSKPTKKQRDWIKKVEALRKEYTSVQIDEPEYNKRMSELQSRSPFEKTGGYNPFPNTKEVYTKLDHEPSWNMEADAVEDVETINTTESPGTFEVMKEKYRDSLDYATYGGEPYGEWIQREDYGSGGMDTSISPENLEEGNDFGSVTDKEEGFRLPNEFDQVETPLRGERTDISREDRVKNRQEARQIALQYIPGATNMSVERLDELLDYISRNDIESFEDAKVLSISRQNAQRWSKLKQRIAAVAPTTKINQKDGETIANAYDKMLHDPNNPAVKESYNALINETNAQFNELKKNGLRIDAIEDDSNPYQTADDLHNDLKKNNHIYYYPTKKGFGSGNKKFGDHPLLTESTSTYKGKKLLNNDVFRIVHDINGHNLANSDFSPEGEHNAFLQHRKMYSPLANKALFSETAAQGNWVSWNKKSGASNRKLTKEGRINELVFADQKAGILSDDIVNTEWHTGETRTGKLKQRLSRIDITESDRFHKRYDEQRNYVSDLLSDKKSKVYDKDGNIKSLPDKELEALDKYVDKGIKVRPPKPTQKDRKRIIQAKSRLAGIQRTAKPIIQETGEGITFKKVDPKIYGKKTYGWHKVPMHPSNSILIRPKDPKNYMDLVNHFRKIHETPDFAKFTQGSVQQTIPINSLKNNIKHMTGEPLKRHADISTAANKAFKKGDILMRRVGGKPAKGKYGTVGETFYIEEDSPAGETFNAPSKYNRAKLNQKMAVIRVNSATKRLDRAKKVLDYEYPYQGPETPTERHTNTNKLKLTGPRTTTGQERMRKTTNTEKNALNAFVNSNKKIYPKISKLNQRLGRLILGKQRTAVMSKKVADIINSFKKARVDIRGIDGIWDPVEKRVLDAYDEPDRERLWSEHGRRGMGFRSVTDTRGGPNEDLDLIAKQLTEIEEGGGVPALGFDSTHGGSLEAVDITFGTPAEVLSKTSPNQESIGYLDEDGKFTIEKNDRYTGKL